MLSGEPDAKLELIIVEFSRKIKVYQPYRQQIAKLPPAARFAFMKKGAPAFPD